MVIKLPILIRDDMIKKEKNCLGRCHVKEKKITVFQRIVGRSCPSVHYLIMNGTWFRLCWEITVEPPVTTSSIDREKQFVSKMFTQKVPAVEWCVRTSICDRGNLGNYFDKFISFYSKSLKNHCSRNKMKTKRKEVLLLTYLEVYVFISVTTRSTVGERVVLISSAGVNRRGCWSNAKVGFEPPAGAGVFLFI